MQDQPPSTSIHARITGAGALFLAAALVGSWSLDTCVAPGTRNKKIFFFGTAMGVVICSRNEGTVCALKHAISKTNRRHAAPIPWTNVAFNRKWPNPDASGRQASRKPQ